MRIAHRLTQYQRLYQIQGKETFATTVAELAAILFCSERHVRTLLQLLQSQGWISWRSQPGRGKRARLQCLKTPEELRAFNLQQMLKQGDHQGALQLAQVDPQHLQTLLTPHLGGQWQADSPTLRIPFYRTLESLDPLTLSGRAEQHLVYTLHAGLTRFRTGNPDPQPDLAHHWQVSDNGLSWLFFLRSNLHWHSGEPLHTRQLCTTLNLLLTHDASAPLLASVRTISQPHALCLHFELHQPDYWLAHRLADLRCLLPHPESTTVGAGSFKLITFAKNLVRLESHPFYHLRHPYLAAIEYWITPEPFSVHDSSCQHPVRITIGQREELPLVKPVQRSMSLGFCYLAFNLRRGNISAKQAKKVLMLIQRSAMLDNLPLQHGLVIPSQEMLPGLPIPRYLQQENLPLPVKLTLLYHPPVELAAVTQSLQRMLQQQGCELEIRYHPDKEWQDRQQLADVDLILGDRLMGEAAEATLEHWLRLDPLWPAILPEAEDRRRGETLLAIQQEADEHPRFQQLKRYYRRLMKQPSIVPLFNYQYQISAPPRVNGIVLNAYGWFDFNQAWVPPPLEE